MHPSDKAVLWLLAMIVLALFGCAGIYEVDRYLNTRCGVHW